MVNVSYHIVYIACEAVFQGLNLEDFASSNFIINLIYDFKTKALSNPVIKIVRGAIWWIISFQLPIH